MLIKTEELSYEEVVKKLSTETGKYQAYFKVDIIRLDSSLQEKVTPDTWEIAIINQHPMFRHIGVCRIGIWRTKSEFLRCFSTKPTFPVPVFKLIPAGSGPSCRDFHNYPEYPEYPVVHEEKRSFWSNLFGSKQ